MEKGASYPAFPFLRWDGHSRVRDERVPGPEEVLRAQAGTQKAREATEGGRPASFTLSSYNSRYMCKCTHTHIHMGKMAEGREVGKSHFFL